MKPTNVLLLDLNPAGELGHALRSVLEVNAHTPLNLQQEPLSNYPGHESHDRVEGRLAELITRCRPAVIYLVSPWHMLQRAKTLFRSLRREPPAPPLVVVSDAGAPEEIFEVIKLGVEDFFTPPLRPADILPRLWRLLEQTCWGETLAARPARESKQLIGESAAFLQVVNKIPIVAGCDATVLISGETGTGKEVCAHTIHRLSPRAARTLVAVNCGSIPNELVESELFGHERGAFTGAQRQKPGLIQEAEGGTLFLDELDSLPLMAQVKLLRFLQEREYRPVGATKVRHADVRVIAATNVNLETAVRAGKLRQDLYYRLNMIPLALPPLRDRREDIPLLAVNFLARYAREFRKHVNGFSPDALLKLCLHDWPGNVRELENAVGRAVAFAEQTVVRAHDLVLTAPPPTSFQQMKKKMIEQFERTYIQSLLIACNGNITKAAEAAQKDRRAFFELIRKHGIDAEQFRGGSEQGQQ